MTFPQLIQAQPPNEGGGGIEIEPFGDVTGLKGFFNKATEEENTQNPYYYDNPSTKTYRVYVEITTDCGIIKGSQAFDLVEPIEPLQEDSQESALRNEKSSPNAFTEISNIRLYNINGQLMRIYEEMPTFIELQADMEMGVYFKLVMYKDGRMKSKKIFIR